MGELRDRLVSIIVPVYNGETTIARCLDSIINQSYAFLEILVIDDGSTDSSLKFLQEYQRKDPRIVVITQKNRGVSASRNVGIKTATGKYLMFVDCDDEIGKDHVRSYIDFMHLNNVDIIIGGIQIWNMKDASKRILVPDELGVRDKGNIWNRICGQRELYGYSVNKLFIRAFLCEHQCFFDEESGSQEDLDFCISVYGHCDNVGYIDSSEYLYYYEEGKRKPTIDFYIKNELKILRSSRDCEGITGQVEECIRNRILSMVFTAFYESARRNEIENTYAQLAKNHELCSYLTQLKGQGEKVFVSKLFVNKQILRLKLFFKIRSVAKMLFGRR